MSKGFMHAIVASLIALSFVKKAIENALVIGGAK